MHPFVQDPPVGDHVGRITRHEEKLDPRVDSLHRLRQLPSVHLGHHDIGDQKADLFFPRFRQFDRFRGSLRGQDRVAQEDQHVLGHLKDSRFILDDEDALALAGGDSLFLLRRVFFGGSGLTGKVNFKG